MASKPETLRGTNILLIFNFPIRMIIQRLKQAGVQGLRNRFVDIESIKAR